MASIPKSKKNILTNRVAVPLLTIFCCLLWGSAFPMIKIGYELTGIQNDKPFSQLLFAGIRFTLAGLLTVIIWSFIYKRPLLPQKSSSFNIFKLCLFQTVIQYFFFYVGLANTTSAKSSIIKGVGNFITILVACFIFRQEKFTAGKFIGCVAGFSGVIVMNISSSGLLGGVNLTSEGFVLLSNITSAISTCLLKKYSTSEMPVILTGYQFLFGGLIMTSLGLMFGGNIPNLSLMSILTVIYLAFVSAAAYSIWGLLLKYNTVSKISIFSFMTPVCGVLLSALMLGEKNAFELKTLFALLLICLGIIAVNKYGQVKKEE